MNIHEEARVAAEQFRLEHHLGLQPLGDLVATIEQATGIDVAVLNVNDHHEHGLTMLDPDRGVMFIGVASTPHPMRQRSTLAHELAHVLFNDWAKYDEGQWDRRSSGEMRADEFASHLLIPRDGIRELLGTRKVDSLAVLSEIVQWFLVSPQMALIALEQTGYIDSATKNQWWSISAPKLSARYGWSDQYQALQALSQKSRAPQKLLTKAIAGYQEGILSAQAIATLRGISVEEAELELHDAGIVPLQADEVEDDAIDMPVVDLDLTDLEDDPGKPEETSGRGRIW